jgi:glutathione S-transferase
MTNIIFWGLTASPYQLKMQALADYADVPWQRWPEQAGTVQALRLFARLRKARRRKDIERFPQWQPELDEYPAVPFYTLDGKQLYYDSTGLALHLDELKAGDRLVPTDPAQAFVCRLIDEAFDEFGLYMVHHNRWVTSAATNTMGEMTAGELRKLIPPFLRKQVARRLAERQVRRCPYLFSVAPEDFDCAVPRALTPPAREEFPPTHDLLDTAWRRYLAAMEAILSQQPFLLGERFTLADASAYGQLGMNLVDGRAAQLLEELAPCTFRWLHKIQAGKHRGGSGKLQLNAALLPLLECIAQTFIPLMRQNKAAYNVAIQAGQTTFNEAAFDRGEALYDGELLGQPFRSVAKSFQVVVWRDVQQAWTALQDAERQQLVCQYAPLGKAFSLVANDRAQAGE